MYLPCFEVKMEVGDALLRWTVRVDVISAYGVLRDALAHSTRWAASGVRV